MINSQFHEDYLKVSKPRFKVIGVRNDYTLLEPINTGAILMCQKNGWFYTSTRHVVGLYKGQIIKP